MHAILVTLGKRLIQLREKRGSLSCGSGMVANISAARRGLIFSASAC